MPLPRCLFITRCAPSVHGYGTARRGATLIKALAQRYEVSLLLAFAHNEKSVFSRDHIPVKLDRVRNPFEDANGSKLATVPEYLRRMREIYAQEHFDLIFVFRMETVLLAGPLLERNCRRHLDLDELDSGCALRIAALLEALGRPRQAAIELRRSKVMRLLERSKLEIFDRIYVCSSHEQSQVRHILPKKTCATLSNSYPQTAALPPRTTPRPFVFLYIGTMTYLPNEDAVLFFALNIFQRVKRLTSHPVAFHVAGIGHTPQLDSLHYVEGVTVLGYVPEVRPAYEASDALVVPLRAGAGTRIKILEAFAHQRPVVSTPLGAEGLDVQDNQELLLRDSADCFAQACVELIDQPGEAQRIARTGHEFYLRHHTEEAILRRFLELESS